ncbi:D-2-hydroxyacid dehydrogenase [Paenibacillus sp. FJAT-26967]|uniref:D-2-hydroxyacid dehydrogenase n=1 Tax=Paenibacillus sp. FJAT-26967 TaxID=1729690 RepID=UPI000837DB58|nr:D-2-hydroxyacid dehydrogenase [Paenibacillus sp. FJAT-26967]
MLNVTALTKMDVSYLTENLPSDLAGRVNLQTFQTAEEAGLALENTEVLITTGKFDEDWLPLLPKLRWVQTLSAGVDKLPLQEFDERQVTVTNMSGVHAIQMSEYALSVMLGWVRHAKAFYDSQRNKVWNHKLITGELHGQTLGIIGTGSIGTEVARKAKAFDMRILGYSRSGSLKPHFDEIRSGDAGLESLLRESDFVLLLVPGTKETARLLSAEQFAIMKQSAYLINMARGSVVDEADLIQALQNGDIAGAALDVFEQEPLPATSALWEMEQVTMTPHISGDTPQYVERSAEIVYPNLRRFLANEPLLNLVDLRLGY